MKQVVLHVADWHGNDRYYQLPISLLRNFRDIFLAAKAEHQNGPNNREEDTAIRIAWDWFIPHVDFSETEPSTPSACCAQPARYGLVDMRLDVFFLDYLEPTETIADWGELADAEL